MSGLLLSSQQDINLDSLIILTGNHVLDQIVDDMLISQFPRIPFSLFVLAVFSTFTMVMGADAPPAPPSQRILSSAELFSYLDHEWSQKHSLVTSRRETEKDGDLEALADALKAACNDHYYFRWKHFKARFDKYVRLYPEALRRHRDLTQLHQSLYSPETQWQLPFRNLKGDEVTPYELRHLARQQKSLDMTIMYFLEQERNDNRDYFVRQVADLNRAFLAGEYDDAGNGIYEVYRAGRRIHNWLFNHHAYLSSPEYSRSDQLLLVRTFLHHGAQLAERTKRYRAGNHHTKGLAALFEIAASFPMFAVSERWMGQAVAGLLEHMEKEVNADGFQFERSVHYHIGDLENYIRVYQLARLNNIPLPPSYTETLRAMFDALYKITKPDMTLPVEQDDTDAPYAEHNDGQSVFTVATALFGSPEYAVFAGKNIPAAYYWLFHGDHLRYLDSIEPVRPAIGSVALPETGYYIMRNGWDSGSRYLIISAGLSEVKPDHQHGDMLGLYAFAGGHTILPNYQVSYNTPDYPIWKNSWVKNVAIVDSIPQARGWEPNRGGSGFGKWRYIPNPEVEVFLADSSYDYLWGSHNGYDTVGVEYDREILFLKDGFWIIRDHFQSDTPHAYQQIWQGDFEVADDRYISRHFRNPDVTLHILQLATVQYQVSKGSHRQKRNVMVSHRGDADFCFTTLVVVTPSAYLLERDNESVRIPGKKEWQLSVAPGTRYQLGGVHSVAGELLVGHNGAEFWILGTREIDGEAVTGGIAGTVTIYINEKGLVTRLH